MESSSLKVKGSFTARVVKAVAIAAALTGALWTGGWYLAGKKLQDNLVLLTSSAEEGDPQVDCKDMSLGGFPFTIALSCTNLDVDDHANGMAASLGPVRSMMSLFSPSRIHTDFQGPVVVRDQGGIAFAAQWENLGADLDLDTEGTRAISVDLADSRASFRPASDSDIIETRASKGNATINRDNGDLNLTATFSGITVAPKEAEPLLPPLDASLAITLAGKADYMNGWPSEDDGRAALRNTSGQIATLTADLGEGRILRVSGPFSISDTGLLSGDFSVTLENVDGWGTSLRQMFPAMDNMIRNAVSMIKALGRASGSGSITIAVRDGVVALGFIPLGTIPPI